MPPGFPALRRLLLLQRDVPSAAHFYERALGATCAVCTESYAEISLANPSSGSPEDDSAPALALQRAESESQLTPGYTPILVFEVADVNARVNAALRAGGRLDGKIAYDARGATACVRAPDGHVIGLFQRAE
ncbi:Glyoxalase-like domain [Ostreococcus tauri]|uniref:Glyoxalase-like domain n=1 Tax=Ostreococcus tauri TaxID=70448 RepID=Q015X1_OSTTA|nr:Glyoxalase-like domain [Ostreococcus tauri]OUS47598.1 lactoylglutathione lyase family protein [Ostreococcus tauri]CAL54308.1 Glyoxalase-like domain [Ostreococcus tauri]|eukprot:XP_003080141.1 Glyoxalase-like domain [Ostreococcus tauri]